MTQSKKVIKKAVVEPAEGVKPELVIDQSFAVSALLQSAMMARFNLLKAEGNVDEMLLVLEQIAQLEKAKE